MARFSIMKWFKKKRSKSLDHQESQTVTRFAPGFGTPRASEAAGILLAKFPQRVLECIFAQVCPHARDETYESCEQAAADDTCMLCDLRDLSHCAQVSRRWRTAATAVLYHSIRIDQVHYCPLEGILAEKRKRKSKLNRNAEPEDTAHVRLQLLSRTLRGHWDTYALQVQFLKTPYMTRETSKPELARAVSVCHNIRYLDLPDGFFADDPACQPLKAEVQGRCPDIRKMAYKEGSERSLELLAGGLLWRNLEVLELSSLNMDPAVLRQALGSLPRIHAIKIRDMKTFNDQLLKHDNYLPPFPALKELIIEDAPNVTAQGLTAWLSRHDTKRMLKTLSLTETGVLPTTLKSVLDAAPRLEHFTIAESVTTSFPPGVPPLSSTSLRTLHYEITSASSANSYTTTPSYYAYLTASLLSKGLPNLRELYVRDPDFPESLIDLAPPAAPFQSDLDNFIPKPFAGSPTNNRFSSNNPFANTAGIGPVLRQELEIYSKGLEEMEWNFLKVEPSKGHNRSGSASVSRPISSYGLSNNIATPWTQNMGARRSVIVGNDFGGLLKVPSPDDARPSSSAGERRSQRGSHYDMWR